MTAVSTEFANDQAAHCVRAAVDAEPGVVTPTGKPRWTVASVRGILRNQAYAGPPPSALLPAGPASPMPRGRKRNGIEAFCQATRAGLAAATFEQRRHWPSCSSTA